MCFIFILPKLDINKMFPCTKLLDFSTSLSSALGVELNETLKTLKLELINHFIHFLYIQHCMILIILKLINYK